MLQLKTIILRANTLNHTGDSDEGSVVILSFAGLKYSKIGTNTAIKIRTTAVPKLPAQQAAKRGMHSIGSRDHNKFLGKVYESDFIILDKAGKCVLTEGEYELKLNVRSTNDDGDYKNLRWQELPRLYADNSFSEHPTLKFRLVWSRGDHQGSQDCNGNVNRRNANNTQLRDDSSNGSDISNGGVREIRSGASSSCSRSSSSSSSSGHGTMTDKLTKPTNNNKNKAILRLHDCTSRIIYRFIYNKNMSQQTETFENWNCPWCKLNCIHLDSLMVHLRLTHDDFEFEFTPTTEAVIIDVTIRKRQSAAKHRQRQGRVKPREEVFFFRSKSEKRNAAVATAAKMALGDGMMMECDDAQYARGTLIDRRQVFSIADGHNRLYYHSQSCMPIYTAEEFEADSEGEPDPAWLTQNCRKLVYEFTDVNEGEKEIITLWNAHVMERNYVGDLQMVEACDNFINQYGCELIRKNLYRNFLLHLTNLFDFGLITCRTVHEMASKLQQMHS